MLRGCCEFNEISPEAAESTIEYKTNNELEMASRNSDEFAKNLVRDTKRAAHLTNAAR